MFQSFAYFPNSLAILKAILDNTCIEMLCRYGLIDSFLVFFVNYAFEYGGIIQIHICLSVEQRKGLFKIVISFLYILLDEGEGGLYGKRCTIE
jgi:dolichyl-phosphate-mannose--protein O-mannosyl transferase